MVIKINGSAETIKNILFKIIKVFLTFYIVFMAFISIDGLTPTDTSTAYQAKYAIVYGLKVESDGSVSKRLAARLDKAYELFKGTKVEKIIVSGGIGKEGFSEAEVMRDYLVNKSVNLNSIIVDSNGYTTYLTSKNSFSINQSDGNYPNIGVIGVSQFFHISRVKLSLKNAGFVHVGSASPDYFELRDLYSIVREVPAYIKYFYIGIIEGMNLDKDDLKDISKKLIKEIKE